MRSSAAICRCSRFCAWAGRAARPAMTATIAVLLISVRCNHKMAPPVPRHRLIRLPGIERELLAVADRANAIGGNAERDEECFHRQRAPLAQSEVVLRRAALIAMAFDR